MCMLLHVLVDSNLTLTTTLLDSPQLPVSVNTASIPMPAHIIEQEGHSTAGEGGGDRNDRHLGIQQRDTVPGESTPIAHQYVPCHCTVSDTNIWVFGSYSILTGPPSGDGAGVMLIDSIGQGTHAGPVHTTSGGVSSQITVTPADSAAQPASYTAQQTTLDDVSTQSYGIDCATSWNYPTYTSHLYEVGHYLSPPFIEFRSNVFPQWPAQYTATPRMWNLYFSFLVFISDNTPVSNNFYFQETSKHSNHNNHCRISRTSMRTSLPPHLQLILSIAKVVFQLNRTTYSHPHPMRELFPKSPSPHT